MPKVAVALREKMLLSIEETAAVLGIGRDLVYRLVLDICPATGKPLLHSVKVGRRRMISWRAVGTVHRRGGK